MALTGVTRCKESKNRRCGSGASDLLRTASRCFDPMRCNTSGLTILTSLKSYSILSQLLSSVTHCFTFSFILQSPCLCEHPTLFYHFLHLLRIEANNLHAPWVEEQVQVDRLARKNSAHFEDITLFTHTLLSTFILCLEQDALYFYLTVHFLLKLYIRGSAVQSSIHSDCRPNGMVT